MDMTRRALPTCLALLFLAAGSVRAQIPLEFGPEKAELSREDLTMLLQTYEEAVNSPAYSDAVKTAARANVARIRERLEEGDFKVGDRVVLSVQGEADLPDTVVVEPGPQITLPLFGSVPLKGVLRSEVAAHLTKELGRIIRDPVVRAQGLMRLSVQGSVNTPGFYVVPADMVVTDALMMAGGPRDNANLEDLRIERGSRPLIEGQLMQDALRQGRTLDQLSLQAGDQIFLPERRASPLAAIGRYAIVVLTAVFLGVRIAG